MVDLIDDATPHQSQQQSESRRAFASSFQETGKMPARAGAHPACDRRRPVAPHSCGNRMAMATSLLHVAIALALQWKTLAPNLHIAPV